LTSHHFAADASNSSNRVHSVLIVAGAKEIDRKETAVSHVHDRTARQENGQTGVTTRTLRFYDRKGLPKPSHLSESGRRFYTDKDLLTLQNILVLKYLGYSLDEIRTMLRSDAGQFSRNPVRTKIGAAPLWGSPHPCAPGMGDNSKVKVLNGGWLYQPLA